MFASNLGNGPTYWLSQAFRVMQLPLGIFGVALGTVALPLLARMAALGNFTAFRSELARGMRLALLLTIPATFGLMMLADPIMSVLYQHGKFGVTETLESAGALRFYALGLASYAALKVLVNAFYAIDRRKAPMVISLIAVGLNLLLNWIFTLHLGWGHRGLAFSTSCIAIFNFVILYVLMRRHLRLLETRVLIALLLKIGVASLALVAVCWLGEHYVLADWPTQAFMPKLAWLLATITVAALAFLGCTLLLRVDEVDHLRAIVSRKLRRSTPAT